MPEEYQKEEFILKRNIRLLNLKRVYIINHIEYLSLLRQTDTKDYSYELKQDNDELEHIRSEVISLVEQIHALELNRNIKLSKLGSSSEIKERKKFIKPCPATDCRGLLSTQYICGLCSTKVCPDCLEIKNDKITYVNQKILQQPN